MDATGECPEADNAFAQPRNRQTDCWPASQTILLLKRNAKGPTDIRKGSLSKPLRVPAPGSVHECIRTLQPKIVPANLPNLPNLPKSPHVGAQLQCQCRHPSRESSQFYTNFQRRILRFLFELEYFWSFYFSYHLWRCARRLRAQLQESRSKPRPVFKSARVRNRTPI